MVFTEKTHWQTAFSPDKSNQLRCALRGQKWLELKPWLWREQEPLETHLGSCPGLFRVLSLLGGVTAKVHLLPWHHAAK